ncbi:MAG: AraC family transcriptional regulator [Candidatus Omnitrophota bacterium]|jgi:predicted transcriptional regulator YdeE|nr:MAG: AraC family transcriptional regulator [Candidatus Omnitrophota bacterium]
MFLLNKIEKEPQIVTLSNPIYFVGLSVHTGMKTIYTDAAKLGKDYTLFKETHPIPDLKQPWAFVAYSKDFNEDTKTWEYIMGDVVTNLDSIPPELKGYEIPSGTYAIFPIKAKFKFLWGLEIGRMKRYVFTQWLPHSPYQSTGCDFEYHDARSVGRNPSIDLYVGIQEKK